MEPLPNRVSPRLPEYDYNSPGAYFLTICTHNKIHLLSNIVGAIHESPVNQLTPYGKIVEEIIKTIPSRFQIEIPHYVVMPNHIHLLLIIPEETSLRAIRESPLQTKRPITSKIVGYLKMNSSRKIHRTYPEKKIWQRSFHDHIIRGKHDYEKIRDYIETNVIRWEQDCFY